MSQYIQGLVDYTPLIQPFQPDFNFYQQVLQLKNAQYEEGYNKLSGVYGTLLNSPLLRQANVETRNKFFNNISSQITKISSMDLSRSENVDAAYKVFQPLINDKYLAKDMVFTKDARNELQRADEFRNCTDEKKCGGKYWEGGIRSIYYKMDDFAKSSNDESLRFSSPKYVPATNVVEKAMKFAKEQGFNKENITYSPDGRFLIKTSNGEVAVPYLTDLFNTMFVNDQTTIDYYNELGYLKRKDYVEQNKDQFATPEEAELHYLNTISSELIDVVDTKNKTAQKTVDHVNAQSGVIKAVEKTRPLNEKDPVDQKTMLEKQQLEIDKLVAEMNASIQQENKEILNPEILNSDDIFSKRSRIDSVVASTLLQNDLARAAYDYAMLTQKVDFETNDYKLEEYKHSLDLQRDAINHKYRLEEIKAKKKPSKEESEQALILKELGERFRSKSATGAGESGKIDLFQEEFKIQTDQSNASAEKVKNVATSMINALRTVITLNDGVHNINGSSMTVNQQVRDAAKNYLEQIFTTEKAVTETKVKAKTDVPSAQAVIGTVTGIPSFISNWFLPNTDSKKESGEQIVTISKKGLYDENYYPKLDNNEDFYNPSSNIYWEKVWNNIQKIAGDPGSGSGFNNTLFNQILLGDSNFHSANEEAKKTYKAYDASRKFLANKERGVNDAVVAQFDVSDSVLPEYAASAIYNYVKSGGGQKTKEEFVRDYANPFNYAPFIQKDGLQPIGFSQKLLEEEAEDIYDQYTTLYRNAWNQEAGVGRDILKAKAINSSLIGGFTTNKGAGIEQAAYSSTGSSSVVTATTRDYLFTYDDLQNAVSNPEFADQIKVLTNVDGSSVTREMLVNASLYSSSEKVQQAMSALRESILTGKKGKDSAFWEQTVHPIIGNDGNTVGFEITLGDNLIDKPGKDAPEEEKTPMSRFVITMPKQALSPENQIVKRLERGPYTMAMIMDPDNKVTIDEYSTYGGSLQMKAVEIDPGGLVTKAVGQIELKFVDENGNLQVNRTPIETYDVEKTGNDAMLLFAQKAFENSQLMRNK